MKCKEFIKLKNLESCQIDCSVILELKHLNSRKIERYKRVTAERESRLGSGRRFSGPDTARAVVELSLHEVLVIPPRAAQTVQTTNLHTHLLRYFTTVQWFCKYYYYYFTIELLLFYNTSCSQTASGSVDIIIIIITIH